VAGHDVGDGPDQAFGDLGGVDEQERATRGHDHLAHVVRVELTQVRHRVGQRRRRLGSEACWTCTTMEPGYFTNRASVPLATVIAIKPRLPSDLWPVCWRLRDATPCRLLVPPSRYRSCNTVS
jgi:hypothetical protein